MAAGGLIAWALKIVPLISTALLSTHSWLTWGYLGWRGLVGVYIFFWLAAAVQR